MGFEAENKAHEGLCRLGKWMEDVMAVAAKDALFMVCPRRRSVCR